MMGLEPTTFCMASRRSSQLSYIRAGRQYSRGLGSPPRRALLLVDGVEGLVDEPVGELVVLAPDRRPADAADPARQP